MGECGRAFSFGKVILPHEGSRDRSDLSRPLSNRGVFVVKEEERVISLDRASQCAAELILLIRRLGLTGGVEKEIVGVQYLVAEELPDISVKLVGSGFDGGVDGRARIPAEGHIVRVGLNLKLRQGIHGGNDYLRASGRHVLVIRVVVDSIQDEIILEAGVPIDAEQTFAASRHDGAYRVDSRGQEYEVVVPPAVERQFRNRLLSHYLADAGGLRIQQGRGAGNLHFLRDRA